MKLSLNSIAGPNIGATFFLIFILSINSLFSACSNDNVDVLSNSGVTPTDSSQVVTQLARYTMPSEISAVPTKNVDEQPEPASKSIRNAQAADDPETDYTKAKTKTYVEEQILQQFDMIEDVLDAINQTRYWDEIGNGAYKAMVATTEEEDNREQKLLQSWVVESEAMRDDQDEYYLRVRAWIEKEFEADAPVIKAEFKIYTPPTLNSDGSYKDYGAWEMNMKVDETGEDEYFTASCTLSEEGVSIIKLHQKYSCIKDGFCSCTKTKGIMYRSATEGYGKIFYPDDEAEQCEDCPDKFGPVHKEAVYAYNQNYLAMQEEGDEIIYKDRNDIIQMTQSYGIFDATTGADVLKTKSFGFPIRYTEGNRKKFAYYGAWQGRHEIWTNDDGMIKEGTVVTREDTGPDQPEETYVVGKSFAGILIKKEFQEASLTDLEGIALEVFIDQDFNLFYDEMEQKWYYCKQVDFDQAPPECIDTPVDFESDIGFDVLLLNENNTRKEVRIEGFDNNDMEHKFYVYQSADAASGFAAGFYEAVEVENENGPSVFKLKMPKTVIDTSGVRFLHVWIGGNTYIVYKKNRSAWFEKEVLGFDENTNTPQFNSGGDVPFSFPEGKELFVNMRNASYVLKKTASGFDVRLEIQTAVNPVNVSALIPDGITFYDQWNPEYSSTYEFVTNPSQNNYMMLVYKTIGDNDRDPDGNADVTVGSVARNVWGITATIAGQQISFNWEFSENEDMGQVTYLMEVDTNAYKLVDDPLRFNPITVQNNNGETKKLYLQYDGWLNGLPDLRYELEKSGWVITDAIKNKIINLPEGTQLVETSSSTEYLLKPLEVSSYLDTTTDPGNLPFTEAQALRLETVPVFKEHGMGEMPDVSTIKYSEGYLVE